MSLEVRLSDTDEALDLLPGAALRTSKSMDRVDELGRIVQEAALSLTLPDTARNRRLLARSGLGVMPDFVRRTESVTVRSAGVVQPLTALDLLSYREGQGWEAEPYAADWQDQLAALPIAALELGTVEWVRSSITDIWAEDRGAVDLLPLVAHYGDFFRADRLQLEDLRIWVSLRHLLRRAFAAIGWAFTCPHLERGDGRGWFGYFGGTRWHYQSDKRVAQYLRLGVTEQQSGSLGLIPWQVEEDSDGTFRNYLTAANTLYHYDETADGQPVTRIEVEVVIDATVAGREYLPGRRQPELVMVLEQQTALEDRAATEVVHQAARPVPFGSGDVRTQATFRYYYEAPQSNDPENPADYEPLRLRLRIYYVGGDEPDYYIHSATAHFRPDPPYYERGSQVDVTEGMDAEVNCLDVLNGVAHLINAKFTTDLARKRVTMHVPFAYLTTNEPVAEIGGFLLTSLPPMNMAPQTVPQSLGWSRQSSEARPRYYLYDFADSDDEAIEEADRERWQRLVDTGNDANTKTEERRNPLFEPTADTFINAAQAGGSALRVPALWEKGRGELSRTLGPRIVNYYGPTDPGGQLNLDGVELDTYPAASMYSGPMGAELRREPITFAANALADQLRGRRTAERTRNPDAALVTGDTYDLYQRHYAAEVNARQVRVSVLLNGGDPIYDVIDFRRLLIVSGHTGDVSIQPERVADHQRGSRQAMLVEGYPVE